MTVKQVDFEPGYRAVAATLRRIADEIEAGETVNEAVVVTLGDEIHVYGTGAGTHGSAHVLLALAQRHLEDQVLAQLPKPL